ncbi:hypothetical protein [Streptomyces sp. NBC_00286]|uniref:hypothetical protein n=1 Tax=Streptomyces sp. NBC_00286 TaxID=2975701 RepID=UPI002E2B4E10|nr:hypothetical protein [Streptomyces sp. NBC_00286]
MEHRVGVVLAGLGVEADVLDRRERGGQEVSQLAGSLEVELFGERRDEHDVRAQGTRPRRRRHRVPGRIAGARR